MDEVDGMSGGDRGGVADLIETIKRSKVPVIAICNDKYHQKLRSLRNHCLELEFRCFCANPPPLPLSFSINDELSNPIRFCCTALNKSTELRQAHIP